ncbi:MAG: ribonuclease J [Chloroflexota bacterium]
MASQKVRIVPLGGLGEVGKNMMTIEYGEDILVIDAGIMFPENDMLGIDFIIPDFQYLLDKKHRVRAIIVTHGHEDHTGALPYVLREINAPVYTTPLTRGLIEVKLKQTKLLDSVTITTIRPGDRLHFGPFTVEPYHVCHSIPDNVGLAIDTPVGLIVHSGDFKFDHTPVDGKPTDFAKLAEFSGRGVLALLSDSTNADRPGWTPSERTIDAAFDAVFRTARGRIIVATFASLISRIQQVANCALRYERVMAIAGLSMAENVRMAQELGYLQLPPGLLVRPDDVVKLPPEKIVILATGAQGEPSAVLGRLAHGKHRWITLTPGDTVIISAHPIPGNEEMVNRTINRLFQRGADVLYDPIAPVHVSGHASQEEQKLLLNLIRPKFFIPVHGELRHLKQHAKIAMELGIPREHIAVVENGYVIELDRDSITVGERVPGGYVFVDGSSVGEVTPAVIRDRETLARDGIVIAVVPVDPTGHVTDRPEIISRGFVRAEDSDELLEGAREAIIRSVNGYGRSPDALRLEVEEVLSAYLYSETKRRPMVFAVVTKA